MVDITDKLMICLMKTEGNEEKLKDLPHMEFGDMSVVYRIVLEDNEDHMKSFLITNEMLKGMGLYGYDLDLIAKDNAPKNFPYKVRPLVDYIAKIAGIPVEAMPGERNIFLATVGSGRYGAGCIYYPKFMKETAELIGGSFYVIPSSIHEVILIPDTIKMPVAEMKAMVEGINNTEVEPEERLSYNVYHYDCNDNSFGIAEDEWSRDIKVRKGEKKWVTT